MQKTLSHFKNLCSNLMLLAGLVGALQSNATPNPNGEWVRLGEIKNISKFVPTTSTIRVSRDQGRVFELSLTAKDNSVRIHSLYLTFADGQTQSVDSFDLNKDEYQIIEVRPLNSPYVRSIEISAETNAVAGSRANLIVEAQ